MGGQSKKKKRRCARCWVGGVELKGVDEVVVGLLEIHLVLSALNNLEKDNL